MRLPFDIIPLAHWQQMKSRRRLSKLAAGIPGALRLGREDSGRETRSSYILGVRFRRGLGASQHQPGVGVADPVAPPPSLGHGHGFLGRGEEHHRGHLESRVYGQCLQNQMQRF